MEEGPNGIIDTDRDRLKVLSEAVINGRQLECSANEKERYSRTEMTATNPAYLEFIDFIAGGTTPQQILAFHPSSKAQARLEELIIREKENQLSPEEQAEINHFSELEHILRMAKARSEQLLVLAS